jgi:hypothetical protein
MDAQDTNANAGELDERIVGLYAGSLDTFVARRDALVKELRASGERDDATIVKNLRKPSRNAWALDLSVLGTPHAMQALDAALHETLAAHSGKSDVRAAMTGLRNAMRDLAAHGARAAEREGLPVDTAVLTNALHAVVGSQDSLQLLRRGCLAEIPESDGLDFLATLPAGPAPSPRALEIRLRRGRWCALRRAKALIAEARDRAQAAQQKLHEAEDGLREAEKVLRNAEAAANAKRVEVERARRDAEDAAAALHNLEAGTAAS